jgi:hypothetical protein
MFCVALAALAISGCGEAMCQEECEEDSDCASGLSCIPTLDGPECLPSECDSCASVCGYLYRYTSDDEVDCKFSTCS